MRNVRARRWSRARSTISQQLVKNLFLSRERNLLRKFHEALLAVTGGAALLQRADPRVLPEPDLPGAARLVERLRRRGGLALLLQQARPGDHARRRRRSSSASSRRPNQLSPYRDPDAALGAAGSGPHRHGGLRLTSRRRTRGAYRQTPLRASRRTRRRRRAAPYFVDYVRELLAKDISEIGSQRAAASRSSRRSTGRMQEEAERIVQGRRAGSRLALACRRRRARVPRRRRSRGDRAFDGIHPRDGPGTELTRRARTTAPSTRAGSGLRVQAVRLRRGPRLLLLRGGAAARRNDCLEDEPDTFQTDAGPWSPRRTSRTRTQGRSPSARAIARSLNVATVQLAQMVGMPKVIEMARTLGIESRLRPGRVARARHQRAFRCSS